MREEQEKNARRLIAALREMPADKTPYDVPGDGKLIWDYGDIITRYDGTETFLGDNDPYPEGFCGAVGCALGLAHLMGIAVSPSLEYVAAAIGLDRFTAQRIFMNNDTYGVEYADVTPAMVAGELEEAIFGKE